MKSKTAFPSSKSKPSRRIGDDPSLDVTPASSGEIGPNGYPVGYNSEGDKVEWIPSEEEDRVEFGEFFPMILRRNDAAIEREFNDLQDKVWWNRHQVRLQRLSNGEEKLLPSQEQLLARANEVASEIEKRVGIDNLGWDDFELGLLKGRMSALSWVQGAEWDESLDT